MRVFHLLMFAVILLLVNGCATRSPEGSRNKKIAAWTDQPSRVKPVELIDQQGLNKIIAERNGKPLLLNIWATWCQPCVAEIPDLIRLSVVDTLVDIVGISVDYPDELHSKVMPLLERLNVPFPVYIARFDKQEDFIAALDTTWSGAVPATYFYDRWGKKQLSHIGQETFEQFAKSMRKVETVGNVRKSLL